MRTHAVDRVRLLIATWLAIAGLCLALPVVAQAATTDLQFESYNGAGVQGSGTNPSGYTVYIRDGDTAVVELKVTNTTDHDIDYISLTSQPSYPLGDDEVFKPILFPRSHYGRIEPPVENAEYYGGSYQTSDTTAEGFYGFTIEPGVTATFTMNISTGDLPVDTYNWQIQLGRERVDFTMDDEGFWPRTGSEVVEVYSAKIPLKVVVYNQAGASLAVGQGTGWDPVQTPLPVSGIDFGTINLQTASDDELIGQFDVNVVNSSTPDYFVDDYGNTISITVAFGGDTISADGEYYASPFGYGSNAPYGANWDPLPPSSTEGGTQFSVADATISFNATNFIAGTYTGDFIIYTTPHKVSINGEPGNATGVYRFPVTITLEGRNPRLLPAVTDLTASNGNGAVRLTWTPAEGSGFYTEYSVYRRVGRENQTNPDKLNWGPYEKIGTKQVGYNDELLFVDGNVENGTIYSYTVICGEPYKGYASAAVIGEPDASIQSPMLAPLSTTGSGPGYVTVSWHMCDEYGGTDCDGAGMVEYFNIYRDGVIVDRVYQSAVEDMVEYGWHDDGTGTGTSIYGPKSHRYSWSVDVPVSEPYVSYNWTVSAVSPSGIESDLDEEGPCDAYSDTPVITRHSVWFDDEYYVYANLDEFDDVPAIAMQFDTRVANSVAESLDIWKSVGTTPPDTSQVPYVTVSGSYAEEYGGNVQFADKNVVAGQTYTYTVRATGENGKVSDFYTFTVKAIAPTPDNYVYFESPNVSWGIINGTSAKLTFSPAKNITATVYRNGTKINYTPSEGYSVWYFDILDNPGADGTYVYRVEYKENSTGIKTSKEFTFVRNTQGTVDPNSFVAPPDAPTLTGHTSGRSSIILSWKPATTGGAPEGYHLYRSDAGTQRTGGRYVSVSHWGGSYYTDEWYSWGNGRYISLAGADTLSFVDSWSNGYYKNDKYLGQIFGLSWDDSSLPHVYWITAYNHAGESEPSPVLVFDTNAEDDDGNAIAPPYIADEAPDAPVITAMWADWEDYSSYRSGFDPSIGGKLRVAWSDSGLGGDPELWTLTYAGGHWEDNGLNPPRTDTLEFYEAVMDPTTKLGTAENSPECYLDARAGSDGDLERALTVTVAVQNAAGTATSEAVQFAVRSFPRFYALPENGGAVLRWTDLFNDSTTEVTSWEIWRKAEYGLWERVGTHSATSGYDGEGTDANRNPVNYYEWTDTGLDNGWAYQYKVVAKCADGVDRPSVVREVTPLATAATEAPGAPRNLEAHVVDGVVYISWDEPATGGAVGYYSPEVYGGSYDWSTYVLSDVTGSSTSIVWRSSEPGTYKLLVWAYSYIGGVQTPDPPGSYEVPDYDSMSIEEKAAVLCPNHSEIIEVQVDEVAQQSGSAGGFSLTLTPGDGQVTVSWTASENALYYTVERFNQDGSRTMPDVTIAAVPGQQSFSYVDETAEPGVKYQYRVTANSPGAGRYQQGYARAYGLTHDQIAANQVSSLIDALPVPNAVTVDDVDEIMGVQAVWESLTADQQELVGDTRAQKLVDDVAAAEELALLEKYAELVAPVQALIDALPAGVDVAAGDAGQIQTARAAYNALTPAEAKKIVKTAQLVEAENGLAAVPAKEAIAALPDSTALVLDDRSAVEAARAAYDALSDDQKACVSPVLLTKLEQDEARIAKLQKEADDLAAAAPVIAAIDALPSASELALTDAGAVTSARSAYDGLTDDQKALVGQERASKLAANEARVAELLEELAELEDEEAAVAVDALIDAIGEVTLESEGAITSARNAYDSIRDSAKQKVSKLAVLEAAEAALQDLKWAGAAASVDAQIEALGEVTLESEADVVAARAAYEALPDGAQAKVTKLAELEAAEARLAQLKAEAKEAADRAAAAAVQQQIAALPSPNAVGESDRAAVAAARTALDGLTSDQRAYVPQASIDKLTALREALETRAIIRIAGDYANETSALISAEAFDKSDWIVLARDDDFADALGATGVAGALNCPIILTDRTSLSPAAANEIKRLGATKCYIIGGTGAMKLDLETGLRSNGITYIERLWGDNSYDTSLACGRKIVELGGKGDEAIIAMSTNFQDALSMSSYAYKYKVPVILQTWGTYATDRGFTSDAQSWLRGKKLIVAGGAGAISDASVSPYTVTARLWGDSGYDTSQAIAEWMVSRGYLSPRVVVLACGAQLPKGTDALAGAALAGKYGAPVLLVNTNTAMEEANTTTVDGFLTVNKDAVRMAYVLGGAYVMPDALYDRIATLIGA